MDYVSPSPTRSAIMRSVGSKNTDLEVLLRKELWRVGLRYRLGKKIEGTRPDLCFVRLRVAVFVDGCFWHGCPRHYTTPRRNATFWRAKIERNRERDRENDRRLHEAGWRVVRLWGCEIKDDPPGSVQRVESAIRRGAP